MALRLSSLPHHIMNLIHQEHACAARSGHVQSIWTQRNGAVPNFPARPTLWVMQVRGLVPPLNAPRSGIAHVFWPRVFSNPCVVNQDQIFVSDHGWFISIGAGSFDRGFTNNCCYQFLLFSINYMIKNLPRYSTFFTQSGIVFDGWGVKKKNMCEIQKQMAYKNIKISKKCTEYKENKEL